jgi:hypothetical protein
VTGWSSAGARALLAAAVLGGTAAPGPAHADEPAPHRTLFSFTGTRIYESSGLVDTGRLVLTVNDSGDGPYVYAVDRRTGDTVGVTTYSSRPPTDVESMAPGAGGSVWVGDTGDNRANRDSIAVYRLPAVTAGNHTVVAPRFELRYSDGPRDAETLLVRPGSERVFVVSKSVFGGTVYRAPRQLSRHRPNLMRPVAAVDCLVTDGAFFPDGRRVLLRTYGTASVYTFPGFRLVGTVQLPSQPQGEGIAVGADGEVLISSEGVHAAVLEVRLPRSLTHPGVGTAPAGPPPSTQPPSHLARPDPAERSPWDWAGIGAVALALVGAAWLTARRGRPPRR